MPTLRTLVFVGLSGLTFAAIPGPSMLYILSRSLAGGRWAGVASAAGLALGGCFLVLAAAFGLPALLLAAPWAPRSIQISGALYLLWLAYGVARDPVGPLAQAQAANNPSSHGRIFVQGFLVEALNPKTLLFFMAFLPQFLDPARGSLRGQMMILGFLVPLTAVPFDLLLAFGGGAMAERWSGNVAIHRMLKWGSTLVLAGLGLRGLVR